MYRIQCVEPPGRPPEMKASTRLDWLGRVSTGVLATVEARTSILSVDILIRPHCDVAKPASW